MSTRPYIVLSAAMSLDGFLDDTSDTRLLLSNDADFDRVDEVRSTMDAILVGANTLRRDNPRLLLRSADRRQRRVSRGLPENPARVTYTASGNLDISAKFFTCGDTERLIYTPTQAFSSLTSTVGHCATVIDAGEPLSVKTLVTDLADRGVNRLMVEGGSATHTLFLSHGLVDELHLSIAPFFVGDSAAPRLVNAGKFVHHPQNPLSLVDVQQLAHVVFLRYVTERKNNKTTPANDSDWLRQACALADQCPPSPTFRVGAIIVDAQGKIVSTGYSGETSTHDHAEEVAITKAIQGHQNLAGATIFSSVEPCGHRKSRTISCAQRIIDAGISRVVFAWREPTIFVEGNGAQRLTEAGCTVVEIPELADLARKSNAHLMTKGA